MKAENRIINSIVIISIICSICVFAFEESSFEPVYSHFNVAETSQEKININTANFHELDSLKGIGKILANRIIEYRTVNGPFDSVYDLTRVQGVKKSVVTDNLDILCTE